MLATLGNRFHFDVHNLTNWALPGSSITPGNNTFPAYVEILADTAVTQDCYAIGVYISNGASVGLAKDTLVNIGFDPTGGTTFTTLIPNLLGSASWLTGPGIYYLFPLYVKSGTSLAAQASVNNATVGTVRVGVRLFGQPSRPEVVKCGSYVTSFGDTVASSAGTAVTPGASNAEGAAWVQLGANAAKDYWWWQVGLGVNNTVMSAGTYTLDLAAGSGISANDVIVKDELVTTNTSEQLRKELSSPSYYADVPSGVGVYGRCSFSTTVDTGVSMIAYGLGG